MTVSGHVEHDGMRVYGYARIKCKAWRCPECGPIKARKLQQAISEKATEHGLTRFLTLTLDPKTIPPNIDEVAYIREVLRKFRVYLKRKYTKTVSYISVLEFHKSGRPHLHVLVDRYISQAWISKSWEALGGGRIVHIERVADLGRVGYYLSKYVTKSAILSAPWGMRRYTTSRDVRLFEKRRISGWWLADHSIEWLYHRAGMDILKEDFDMDGSIRFFVSSKNLEN